MSLAKRVLLPGILILAALLAAGCGKGKVTAIAAPQSSWLTVSPESQGVDEGKLNALYAAIQEKKIAIHSVLIIRHGFIVSEYYTPPYDQNTIHELYSCTKSFISTLVGIAVDRGDLPKGIQQPILELLPQTYTFANLDARKQAITLENLLTMSSGLEWEESDTANTEMYDSYDWVQYVLDKPVVADPGSLFNYSSGTSHVISAILDNNSWEQTTLGYARRFLLKPLGISHFIWLTDYRKGITIGGWGLQLTPRDMAKLGYLYLHNGKWGETQIVSEAWVKSATQKHISVPGSEMGYGYQWWVYPRYGAYAALGRYGQTIFVLPEQDMVIVFTAAEANHNNIFKLIDDYIVPAVKQ